MATHRRDKSTKNPNISDDLVSFHQPNSEEIAQIFFGKGSEELTDKLIEELVARGWERQGLDDMQKDGYRYNRSRDSLIEGKSHFQGF